MWTSTTHSALRAPLHPVLAWPLCRRGSLPLRALPLEMRLFVFPIYPIVVSDRLHLDIGDIVVGHFLLDGYDRLDQPVWAPDCGNRVREISAGRRVVPLEVGGRPEKIFSNVLSGLDLAKPSRHTEIANLADQEPRFKSARCCFWVHPCVPSRHSKRRSASRRRHHRRRWHPRCSSPPRARAPSRPAARDPPAD